MKVGSALLGLLLAPVTVVRGYVHEGALARVALIALGLALDWLAAPPGPVPAAILFADVPLLWMIWKDGGTRWKRWVALYALCHFAFGLRWLAEVHAIQIVGSAVGLVPLYLFLGMFLRFVVRHRQPYVLAVGVGVVLVEIAQTVWMGGMPWPARFLSFGREAGFLFGWGFVPAAAYVGAYGFSFLAGLTSAVASGTPSLFRAPVEHRAVIRRRLALGALLPLAWFGALVGLSALRTSQYEERVQLRSAWSSTEQVVVVQGNIPQELKHSSDARDANDQWDLHLEIAREGVRAVGETDVCAVLLPETMLPWPLVSPELAARFPDEWDNNVSIVQRMNELVPEARHATWLVGAIYHFRRGDELHASPSRYGTFDSLFQLEPEYAPAAGDPRPRPDVDNPMWFPPWERTRHDKNVRVPGGEYTPLGGVIPALRWFRNFISVIPELDEGAVEQTPMILWEGDRWLPLMGRHETLEVRAGTVICFELAFPRRCRALRDQGALVLLNPANYGWFGESDFRPQIRAIARFRAAELGVGLVMAGNTGPTLFYDPLGRSYGHFRPFGGGAPEPAGGDGTTHREGFAHGVLKVDPEGTVNQRLGDLPWLLLGAILLGAALIRRRGRETGFSSAGGGAPSRSEGLG